MEHYSDCATNNAPAEPVGPCDCGGYTGPNITITDSSVTGTFSIDLPPLTFWKRVRWLFTCKCAAIALLALSLLFCGCSMTTLDASDTALNAANWQHAADRAFGYVTDAGLYEPGFLAAANASPSTIKAHRAFYNECLAHAKAMQAAAEKASR